MIWKRTNYKGEEVTWYDTEEVSKILKIVQDSFLMFYYGKKKESIIHDYLKDIGE